MKFNWFSRIERAQMSPKRAMITFACIVLAFALLCVGMFAWDYSIDRNAGRGVKATQYMSYEDYNLAKEKKDTKFFNKAEDEEAYGVEPVTRVDAGWKKKIQRMILDKYAKDQSYFPAIIEMIDEAKEAAKKDDSIVVPANAAVFAENVYDVKVTVMPKANTKTMTKEQVEATNAFEKEEGVFKVKVTANGATSTVQKVADNATTYTHLVKKVEDPDASYTNKLLVTEIAGGWEVTEVSRADYTVMASVDSFNFSARLPQIMQIVFRLIVTLLCVIYMKRSSQSYTIGFGLYQTSKKWLFGIIPLLIISFGYAFVKGVWGGFFWVAMYLFSVVLSDVTIAALGVYLLRKSGCTNKILRFAVPMGGVLATYLVILLFTSVFRFPVSLYGLPDFSFSVSGAHIVRWMTGFDALGILIFAVSLAFFGVVFYYMTHNLFALICIAFYYLTTVAAVVNQVLYLEPATLALSYIIALAGAPLLLIAGGILLALMIVKKRIPGDELCEYDPLV